MTEGKDSAPPVQAPCSGSGRPVFIDIGFIRRCSVCRQDVSVDGLLNAVEHER